MEPHPDLDRAAGQRPLGFHGRPDRVRRPREGDEEGVTLRVDLRTAVRGDGFPDDAAMLGQVFRPGVAEVARKPRRTLDVSEQEGDLAGRQLAGHRWLR